MERADFENEKKWCEQCGKYQRYLMSVNHSFCVECGQQVRLFSRQDAEMFSEDLQKRRWRVTGS